MRIVHPHGLTPGPRPLAPRRAFTLIEVIAALLILSLVSIAVAAMTFGAMNDDRYLRTATASQAEIELAARRIATNIRQAQPGSINAGTTALTVISQADTANGYPNGATVTYSLTVTAGKTNHTENDPRLGGANVIVNNITTFNIVAVAGVSDLYQLDLVTNTTPPVERHLKIYARN